MNWKKIKIYLIWLIVLASFNAFFGIFWLIAIPIIGVLYLAMPVCTITFAGLGLSKKKKSFIMTSAILGCVTGGFAALSTLISLISGLVTAIVWIIINVILNALITTLWLFFSISTLKEIKGMPSNNNGNGYPQNQSFTNNNINPSQSMNNQQQFESDQLKKDDNDTIRVEPED